MSLPVIKTNEFGIAGIGKCSIKINNEETSINIGDTLQLSYTVPNVPLKITSSNSTIATVTDKGLITGLSEGTVIITVAKDK
ncbi:Ig-like domain-containing protein [Paenibacillus alvei]|uniref:Ig-like domain-containing protein n=1 Tax=Paenibacillus alvei TaxID=44250 RepID=UPI0013DA8703|nr:hypothetical protein [Paenibacillus alvei]